MEAWNQAYLRTGANPNSFVRQDEEACLVLFVTCGTASLGFQIKCDSMKLLADIKTEIKHAVDSLYEFDTSRAAEMIGRNATRAQALLAKTKFVYRVRLMASHLQSTEHHHMVHRIPTLDHRIPTLASVHVIHIDIP